jgi:hypothetical protein
LSRILELCRISHRQVSPLTGEILFLALPRKSIQKESAPAVSLGYAECSALLGHNGRLSLQADPDCGDVLTYNYVSGEDITHVDSWWCTPDSKFTLDNFVRSLLYSSVTVRPELKAVAGFAAYMQRYIKGLDTAHAAVTALKE